MKRDYPANESNGDGGDDVELTESDRAAEASEVDQLRTHTAELNDRFLRLAAELENTRRRAEREKADAGRYAISNFARDLLNVADAFERALKAAPDGGAEGSDEGLSVFLTGMRMTERELLSALERHGVKRIDPKGEKFDPNLHQAVAQSPGDAPAGFVLEVAQPGFVIGDRVLRAASVIVSTGPVRAGDAEPGAKIDTSV